MTPPTEQEKEIDEAIDQLWERGHVPKFADDVKTGIKRIAHTYGDKRAQEGREEVERAAIYTVDGFRGDIIMDIVLNRIAETVSKAAHPDQE